MDLTLQLAEAAADFDAVFVHKVFAHRSLVHTLGGVVGGQARQTVFFFHDRLQPHSLKHLPEDTRIGPVALPTFFISLFEDDAQRLVERVGHVYRRRMVVEAVFSPVAHYHVKVEIPVFDGYFAFADPFAHTRGDGERRQTGRAVEAFLGPAVCHIEFEPLYRDFHTAEGGDAVHEQEHPRLVHHL